MESNENTMKPNYSVGELYKKSWEVVKKHAKELATVTLIGVVVNVAVSALVVFAIVNNFVDDVSSVVVSSSIAGIVGILAGVFVGLLQVVALKRVSEGKEVKTSEVVNEAVSFIPRALGYGAFVVGIFVVAGIVAALLGPIGILIGLASIVAIVIALFRYAFVQFLIVEPKEMGFMERFTTSQKLTDGIYGTLFVTWLIAIVLSIGGSIVGGILSSPFKVETSTGSNVSVEYNFNNAQSVQDFRNDLNKTVKESTKEQFGANYIIKQLITQAISWGIGLVVLGALLELYKKRKSALRMQ